MDDEGNIFLAQVIDRGVEARFILLARHEREWKVIGLAEFCGSRLRTPNRAADAAEAGTDIELIPIPAIGLQSLDFDVNTVCPLRIGSDSAFPHDFGHVFVASNTPTNKYIFIRHAAAIQGIWRETSPKNNAVGPGVPRGDSELKGICLELRNGPETGLVKESGTGSDKASLQKLSTIHIL
jgi:hypothetical protein